MSPLHSFSSHSVRPAPYSVISSTCHFLSLQLAPTPSSQSAAFQNQKAFEDWLHLSGSCPHSSAPQTQSGAALPCTWRQAARKEGSSGVGAAVTLVPPARQKAPWGQGLGLPVLWSPQDRALPTVGDQSCWLPDRGMDWMTYEVTLSPDSAIQPWHLLQPLCGPRSPNKPRPVVPLGLCTCVFLKCHFPPSLRGRLLLIFQGHSSSVASSVRHSCLISQRALTAPLWVFP